MVDITLIVMKDDVVNLTAKDPNGLWKRGDIVDCTPMTQAPFAPSVTSRFVHINITDVPIATIQKVKKILRPNTLADINEDDGVTTAIVISRRRWTIDPSGLPQAVKVALQNDRTVTKTYTQVKDFIKHRSSGRVIELADFD